MAKKVSQVRYFGENMPANTHSLNSLATGDAFKYPIVQLGVQALPGTRILINNSETPLVIGATGIYELNIDGLATITSLMVAKNSLQQIGTYKSNLIIDYIYDEEG